VVFDLNGALCKMDFDGKEHGDRNGGDFNVMRKCIYVRPYIHTMLAEVCANYDIAVWTCNSARYAIPIAKGVFGRYFKELKFIRTGEDCSGDNERNMRKNMDTVLSHAPHDIVLIDDTAEKKAGVKGSGLIVISTFFPNQESLDCELLDLKTRIDHWHASSQQQSARSSEQPSAEQPSSEQPAASRHSQKPQPQPSSLRA